MVLKCPNTDCGSIEVIVTPYSIPYTATHICRRCGLVILVSVDTAPETMTRKFTKDDVDNAKKVLEEYYGPETHP